jgi:hypothetical protein
MNHRKGGNCRDCVWIAGPCRLGRGIITSGRYSSKDDELFKFPFEDTADRTGFEL